MRRLKKISRFDWKLVIIGFSSYSVQEKNELKFSCGKVKISNCACSRDNSPVPVPVVKRKGGIHLKDYII